MKLMLHPMDDEYKYPRSSNKFYKHLLKGEEKKKYPSRWIKVQKTGTNPVTEV